MILATSGAGLIGANFVLNLLTQGDEAIVNLDKFPYAGNLQTLALLGSDARHIFVRGDIRDHELVLSLLAEHHPRAVVNFPTESRPQHPRPERLHPHQRVSTPSTCSNACATTGAYSRPRKNRVLFPAHFDR